MNSETLTNAEEQVRAGLSDFADKVKGFSDNVTERWRDVRADAGRRAKRIKIAAEEGIADTRHRIKSRPLSSVVIVASGAFLLGGLAGWILAKSRR